MSAVGEATALDAANKFRTQSSIISHLRQDTVSELFEDVVSTLGVEHILTSAYHRQTDATNVLIIRSK